MLLGIRIQPPARQRKNNIMKNREAINTMNTKQTTTFIGCFKRVTSLALVPGSNRCFKNPALLGRLRSEQFPAKWAAAAAAAAAATGGGGGAA
ncbi:hypothetical protein F511_26340 [Dorcoceras hygrometricum]|uniref:Uncharacterized protein n=1 Tax=Dorcoceras hygrometricum TaxID=472368 RepID=A0A2Z7A9J7_9LAMI|nr:hypothetical protein F511_26340 [Dorcoceras hygrometricum]